jgi:hypothetical protein
MSKAFWAIVAVDAALFVFLLVGTLMQPGPFDGGREMALAFSVILPGVVIAVAILLYVFSGSIAWRVVALLIVAGPGLLITGSRLRNAYYDYRIAQDATGRGYFFGRPLRAMGAAVVNRDVPALRQNAPRADINAAGEGGMTLIGLAADEAFSAQSANRNAASELSIVQTLIALGAKPNPALQTATKLNDPEILRTLLEAGADPNLKISGSPVAFAWVNIMPVANLRLLAQHGADLNAVDQSGTPLILSAAQAENWDAVAFMIEQGADVRRADSSGRTVASFIANRLVGDASDGTTPSPGLLRVKVLLSSASPAE